MKQIEEKADNYMRGRAMALSFKPLTLGDVKEAYIIGAEEQKHIDNAQFKEDPIKPSWHKVAEGEMPSSGTFMISNPAKFVPDFCYYEKHTNKWVVDFNAMSFEELCKWYTHWMLIPTLPKED